jgi:nicotinamide-nucleotide adenylyltransferase
MVKEILACINKESKKFLHSGQISKYIFPMERNQAHNKKISHLITRFFIMSKTPEGQIVYLVQKRGKNKKSFPEYYTDSSSGHVTWTKNLNLNIIKKNALRELEEEFGIPPKAVQNMLFYEINTERDEIAYIFFGFVDYNIPLTPNPNELDTKASKFYNKSELLKLLENERNIDYSKKIWKILLDKDIIALFNRENGHLDKKTNIVLFIGRFQPLHHGHIYVLNNLFKSHKKIKIGIGSSQLSHTVNDPFTSDERKEFLNTAILKRGISPNRYKIYEIPDIFNAKKWVDHVISIVGEFDSVFSNSNWVRELFSNKGIKVEKKKAIFKKKFNGNNIRKLIIRNNKKWKTLVPKEVAQLIEEFNGIDRIKKLNKKVNIS